MNLCKKYGMLHEFSCPPYIGAMLIFSMLYQVNISFFVKLSPISFSIYCYILAELL